MGAEPSAPNADFQESCAQRGARLRGEELPSVESVRTDIPADKSEGRSRPRTGLYMTHDGQREQ